MKKKSKKKSAPLPATGPGKIGLPSSDSDSWPSMESRRGRKLRSPVSINLRSIAKEFGKRREEKKVTVAQLARSLDLPPATLVKLEEKASPIPLTTLITILNEIDCDLAIVPRPAEKKKASSKK